MRPRLTRRVQTEAPVTKGSDFSLSTRAAGALRRWSRLRLARWIDFDSRSALGRASERNPSLKTL